MQDDFLELLSCNENPDIMTAVVQAVDPYLTPLNLEDFKVIMLDLMTYTPQSTFLQAFEDVFSGNTAYWNQLLPGLLSNNEYLTRYYSGYTSGSFEDFIKTKLSTLDDPLPQRFEICNLEPLSKDL